MIWLAIIGGLIVAYCLYLIIRFVWIVVNIRKLHIAVQSLAVNQLALLYAADDLVGVLNYENPYANDSMEFIKLCAARIEAVFFNPFASWNKYILLPDVKTALWMKKQIDNGIATTSNKEFQLRSRELLLQIKEEKD